MNATITMSLFAYGMMVVIAGLSALLIRTIVVVLARAQGRGKPAAPTAVTVSVSPARDETAAHVAAVAAAVHAVLGAQRIVRVGEAGRGVWATLGRSQHQASHTPHHAAPAPRLDHN